MRVRSPRTLTLCASVAVTIALSLSNSEGSSSPVTAQRRRLPDLTINEETLRASLQIGTGSFSPAQ